MDNLFGHWWVIFSLPQWGQILSGGAFSFSCTCIFTRFFCQFLYFCSMNTSLKRIRMLLQKIFHSILLYVHHICLISASMMSWVGCLLTDSELFILFVLSSQILLKISVISIILTFMYLVALNLLKFMFSVKATKIDEIFITDLTLCSACQIVGEDFVNFCGLLRKHEL